MFQPFTFHVGLSSISFVSGEIVFAEIAKTELLKRFPNRNNVIKSPTNAERTLPDLTPQRFSIPRLPTLKQASKQASKQAISINQHQLFSKTGRESEACSAFC